MIPLSPTPSHPHPPLTITPSHRNPTALLPLCWIKYVTEFQRNHLLASYNLYTLVACNVRLYFSVQTFTRRAKPRVIW